MAKKATPRDKWGFNAWSYPQSERDKKIEALQIPERQKLKLSAELHKSYENAIDYFLYSRAMLSDPPRTSEIRASLKRIVESCDQFIEAIQNIDAKTATILRWGGINRNDFPEIAAKWNLSEAEAFPLLNGIEPSDKSSAEKIAEKYRMAAAVALHTIGHDVGGPPPDTNLKNLIISLATIYKTATGKKGTARFYSGNKQKKSEAEGRGAFFLFVKDTLLALDHPIHGAGGPSGDAALVKAIKRAIQ